MKKSTKQEIKNNKGDTLAVNVEDNKGGNINISSNKSSNLGVPVDNDNILFKVGSWLLDKLGEKLFFTFLTILLLPFGGIITYVTILKNYSILNDWTFLFMLSVFLFVISLSIIGTFRTSKCLSCGKNFATELLKKKVLKKGEYKGEKIYNVEETKRCKFCKKEFTKKYTETDSS